MSAASSVRPVVLVTGAARRIGRAIALDLAAHGHDIALHCHQESAESSATCEELRALGAREQQYSVEFGDQVINEVQMELFCEDGEVAKAVEIFQRFGRTGQPVAGWVYVSDVEQAIAIGDATRGG